MKNKLADIYTGKIYADEAVLAAAPRSKKKGAIQFFTVGKYISCAELEKEYASRGLVPADVYTLAEYMEEHQDEDSKATQWKDKDGNYCCATFLRWRDGRSVHVDRRGSDWDGGWSFAGVPEVASELETSEQPLDARITALVDLVESIRKLLTV